MANNEYYEKFKDVVANAERINGEVGIQTERVIEILGGLVVNPYLPTNVEREAARRVKQPDVDDWKKLARCIKYLCGSKELGLTLKVEQGKEGILVKWWIDASFATHMDMRSHTGCTMSLGKGSPYSQSRKQRINTKSLTEAEVVDIDDGMPLVIWTRNFLMAQGYTVTDNVVYQDNQSAILLKCNGRASSGRRT